jgi:hypothetical protein
VLIAAAALLVAIVLITQRDPTSGAVGTSATSSTDASLVPAEVTLSIKASPPEAHVFLDGQPLPSNPFRGQRARDPGIHQLTIDAPGYISRVQDLTLDKDVMLELVLQRAELTPAIDASAKSGASTGAGGRPSNDARPEKKSKKQTLDGTNPYGN